jgi:MFS family permease
VKKAGHVALSSIHRPANDGGIGRLAVRRQLTARLRRTLGGPARTRVILLLACVLGLNTADLASLGAIAGQLKLALHISNTQLGVLAAAPALISALFTLPLGVLADRARRVRVLGLTILLWAGAMALCGAAGSFGMLLVARLFLGAITAASGPLIASLVGDLFAPGERGRVYGYIVAGELLGSLVGLLVAGNLAAFSWRVALWVLALPSVALGVLIWRTLPEPARGGASWLSRGAERVIAAAEAPREAPLAIEQRSELDADELARDALELALGGAGVQARARLVLQRDPAGMSLRQALVYVLRITTNDLLIVSSGLGYFFQAGVNTFGVVFIASQFRLTQSAATSLLGLVAIGALVGTLAGGRLADALLGRGIVSARMLVGGGAFLISTILFVPGLFTRSLAVAIPLYFLAAAALAAPNAALDAARLDIVPGRLRGRAEAIRTVFRTLAVAISPLAFGFVSDQLATGARVYTKGVAYSVSATGLRYTFALMLIPMALGGAILLLGRRRYAKDVATAIASERNVRRMTAPGDSGPRRLRRVGPVRSDR